MVAGHLSSLPTKCRGDQVPYTKWHSTAQLSLYSEVLHQWIHQPWLQDELPNSGSTNIKVWWYIGILGFLGGSDGKESACSAENLSSIPGSGRSHGEGNSNRFQYSCLENPMDRVTWQTIVQRVAKCWTPVTNTAITTISGRYIPCKSLSKICF